MKKDDELVKYLRHLNDEDLWMFYAHAGLELKERKLVRTRNIVGGRGEFLAVKIYNETPGLANLQAAPEGTRNVDALSRRGERYTIKTVSKPGNITGVFYGCGEQDEPVPDRKFEFVVVVVIDKYYKPERVLELTWDQFLKHRRWNKTIRAWNLSLTKKLTAEAKIVFQRHD